MMIEMRDGQSQLSTKNGGGQLGDKFFDGIGITAEAVLEASIESRRMSSPVRQLMRKCCVVMVIGFEEFGWRHGDAITQWLVVGLRAVMAQVCVDLSEEGIEPLFAAFGLKRGNQWLGTVEFGEAIALVGSED